MPAPSTDGADAALDGRIAARGREALRATVLRRVCENPLADASIKTFLEVDSVREGLSLWFGDRMGSLDKTGLRAALDNDITEIDAKISEVVESIVRDERLGAVEALWRSVKWLVAPIQARRTNQVVVRILDMSWRDLARDMVKSPDFDQTALYQKIHNEEFGIAGGKPYGLIVGDYEIRHRPGDSGTDDIATLRDLSKVAAASFCPVILSAAPSFFGVDEFRDLARREDIKATFEQKEYTRFRTFQQTDDARFIGLTVGRLLVRAPYAVRDIGDLGYVHRGIPRERIGGELWTSAAFSLAHVAIRAFSTFWWPAAIRGAPDRDSRDELAGGIIEGPILADFSTDRPGLAAKGMLEIMLGERQETQLNMLGFIAPRPCPYTEYSAIYNAPSVQRPQAYSDANATQNARMGAMLNYLLCVCRFAHYVKIIARDWIGSYKTAQECEQKLQRWINHYCITGDDTGYQERARYPLRRARISIGDVPGRPGSFTCQVHLQPHFQLDYIVSEFELTTELDVSSEAA